MATRDEMSLGDLAERCVVALGGRPEVHEVVAFGSFAVGTADAYSDLDLRVVSEDYALTVRSLPDAVARIDDPLIMLLIGDGPDEVAWAVPFAHRPIWQKLDIGIRRQGRAGSLGAGRSLYRRPPRVLSEPAPVAPAPVVADVPACSAFTHGLYDAVLGATRYVKSRRRGQPLTANRFYQPVLRTMLAVSYNAAAGRELEAPFGSRDYPGLDAIGDQALARHLYPGDARHMDELLVSALVRTVRTSLPAIEEEHIGRLVTIIDRVAEELGVRPPTADALPGT